MLAVELTRWPGIMWSETGYPSHYHMCSGDGYICHGCADFLDPALDALQLPYLTAYSKHLHGFITEYTNYRTEQGLSDIPASETCLPHIGKLSTAIHRSDLDYSGVYIVEGERRRRRRRRKQEDLIQALTVGCKASEGVWTWCILGVWTC